MRRLKRHGRLALLGLLVAVVLPHAAPAASSNMSVNWSPIVTRDPGNGDTIRLTGGGTFDLTTRTVNVSGSFTHSNSAGTVLARGSWRSTGFSDFVEFGRLNNGLVGGILTISAQFFPVQGPADGVGPLTMSIDCEIGRGIHEEEGITVGSFTEKLSGFGTTVFHAGS